MADNPAIRGGQDRLRIDVNEKYELQYWKKKFGVSSDELRSAVGEAGTLAADVEKLFAERGVAAKKAPAKKAAANGGAAEPAISKSVAKKSASPATKAVDAPARKAAAKKAAKPVRIPDAIGLLRADHKRVNDLFEQFEKTRSANKKKSIVAKICLEMTVHAQIEEEIFYPAVKAALRDKELVPEASVEHASVKDLIAQVRDVEPDGEMYDARVTVMGEFIRHHVKEEQNEMFPKAKKTRLDMVALGEQLYARQQELLTAGV